MLRYTPRALASSRSFIMSSTPKPQFHIAIVGAGLGGLAAAISIARAGHKATILEQASALGEVGAGIQIPPNSSRILRRWGILEQIESHSVRPRDFYLRSYKDGKILSTQNTLPYAEDTYGNPYLHIHRADYHRVLVETAEKLGVDIRINSGARGVDFSKPAVLLADGSEFSADLVIGADGLKSVCREALLGHPDPPHLTGNLAYRILIKAEDMKKHANIADLAEHPAINYWMGPDAHVVGYLLKGGGLYNMVLACPDNLPEMVNTAKADLQEMRDVFKGWDPRLETLLSLVEDTSKWRLQNSEEMKKWTHDDGKFALLGDSCHATLPYLASGAAMAIEDGDVLGLLMARITEKSQLSDVLVMYESLRKSRSTRVVKGSTHYQDIFHMHDGDRQRERDRQLLEYQDDPFEGYPNKWRDPVFQSWLWGYDATREVDQAWSIYEKGQFPLTYGRFRSHL
ncbi:3-hydroxybenzoate 6-hydroxylase [Phlyctema vagabunda]|uniref:3-hydroxybenzoate 6-hydroxylase n=1 Tax=Phlyctema vagabunda TaxID=108571 RepID=A0ABR4PLA4_9HELO